MLWSIALVLLILWFAALITGYTFGNFVHILLVVAVVVILLRILQGRPA